MERRRAALLPGSGSRRWSCEKCKASFLSFVNLQRHRAAHRATGAGRRARLSPATREQLAACWDALDLDRRAKSLDFAKPGEAGALLLAGFRSRPATTSASTSGSFDDAFAKYRGGGEILRRAVAGDVRATGAALVAALEGASEGTALRGHKTTTDLERMVEDDNLEAALALLAEEALLRTYVAERSEAAEAAQRALVAEIDEAAAEEERRDARRAKAKAKKARRRSRRKGEDESGSAAVSTAGEGTEGETRDGDVDRDEDDAAAEAVLSRRREDARVDALAAEAAEREAREASAAEAAARRGRDDVRGGESGVKSRGDSAKSGAGTVVGRGRTDSTTAESSPGGGLVASPYGRPKTAPLAARAAKAAATTTTSSRRRRRPRRRRRRPRPNPRRARVTRRLRNPERRFRPPRRIRRNPARRRIRRSIRRRPPSLTRRRNRRRRSRARRRRRRRRPRPPRRCPRFLASLPRFVHARAPVREVKKSPRR